MRRRKRERQRRLQPTLSLLVAVMASGSLIEPGDEGYEQCDDGNQVDDDNCDNDWRAAGMYIDPVRS